MAPVIDLIQAAPDAYGRPEAERPGDVISPSQLNAFMSCSMMWAFRKVYEVAEAPTVAKALGRAVHEATAFVHRHQIATGAVPAPQEAHGAFERAWREESCAVVFPPRYDRDEMESRGMALVDLYVRDAAPRIRPAAVEVELPADAQIGGVRVRGRIDVMERCGKVRDTKTICRKPGRMQTENRFQVGMYAETMPGASGAIAVDYLVKTKNKPQLVQIEGHVHGGDRALLGSVLRNVQQGMRAGNYVPNRVSAACNHLMCGYARVCEAEFGGSVPRFPEVG